MLGPRAAVALSLFAILCVSPQLATAQSTGASYFPATDWERRTPAEARINEALLKQAVEAAITGETKAPRDLVMNHYQTFGANLAGMPSDRSANAAIRPGSSSTAAISSPNGAT